MAIIERERLHELREIGIDTIPRLFRHRVKVWADNVVMREKDLGLWQEITWAEYGQKARYVAAALLDLGLQNGDRVAIISENCPEWLFSDQGIMAAGGVTVGIYTTDSAKQVSMATGQQKGASEQVVLTMHELSDVARQMASAAGETTQSANSLTQMTEDLKKIISRFKLEG